MEMRDTVTKKGSKWDHCCWLWALSVFLEDCEEHNLCICKLERKKEKDHHWEFCFPSISLFSNVVYHDYCVNWERSLIAWKYAGYVNLMNIQKRFNIVCHIFHSQVTLYKEKLLMLFRKKLLIQGNKKS